MTATLAGAHRLYVVAGLSAFLAMLANIVFIRARDIPTNK
jgi:hypothetical protein